MKYSFFSLGRKIFGFLICFVLVNASIYGKPKLSQENNIEPFSIYGSEIIFDVYREGQKIGFHHVKFSKIDNNLRVISESKLQINLLFFTAFEFNYRSKAVWKNGILKDLECNVNDDGKLLSFTVFNEKNLMKVKNSDISVDVPLFPTNHWNANVLNQKKVFNTLTGNINEFSILSKGLEEVLTENGRSEATRYQYYGDIEAEVWYDNEKRWVKMQFEGRDGSTITYRCVKCQGGTN